MLLFVLVPALVGLSLLGQRLAAAVLKVKGPVRPLIPFAPGTTASAQFAVRAAGLGFTFLLVVAVGVAQFSRELAVSSRVEVVPGLAAAEGGLESGDVVVAVEGQPVASFSALREGMLGGSAKKVLEVRRAGVVVQRTVTLRDGVLGVKPAGEVREVARGQVLGAALRFPFVAPWLAMRGGGDGEPEPHFAVWALYAVVEAWWATVFLELAAALVPLAARALARARSEHG